MDEVQIIKNLLLDKTCDNCEFQYKCFPHTPENTCQLFLQTFGEVLILDSKGSIGIGTTSPSIKLSVYKKINK